ncbi:hypothetical protein OR16_15099 [Cupriavidus basilensis OR16]|uniref:Large ribosomal RNA subunit accumulation protein YceD n=1 Tax=Cupriavidus basilensis OR16 TaxID=1127483 RepID=H1S5A6_9BURK|nr:DUF177 domain-containing protein [Cupriavidus basilensis]EHP42273.1 hypothetical protein OR16_15099 [Cupriavidus basilensis OR16]
MTQPIDLRALDLFAFCRAGDDAAGEVAARDLPRIIAETAAQAPASAPDEVFSYALSGFVEEEAGEPGKPAVERLFVDLAVNGRVWLDCQRCLRVYEQPIATDMCFEVVASEADADAAPMDDDGLDVIVGSKRFDLQTLIEDEVLLALPVAPKHDVCPTVHESLVTGVDGQAEPEPEVLPEEEKRPSPFAALAGLKTKH